MFRQRYALILVCLMVLLPVLSACGDDSNSGNSGQSGNNTTATQTTADNTPATGSDTEANTPAATDNSGSTKDATSSGNPQPEGTDGTIEKLDMGGFGGGSNPQINYNPYSPNALTSAYTFEPLLVMNNFSCEATPWLATEYKWEDPQTLTYTIRKGVKWSDGQDFTPDDVVFTFNQAQKYPALDTEGVWQALDNISASGDKVTFKFKTPSVPMFTRVSKYPIVPKHIWEKEADPVKFTNEEAIGTGPFKPTSFNQRQLVLSRNENYWQADKVKVNELVFHKAEAGPAEQLKLARGEYDTNAMFVPNIQQAYISKDPQNNHYWFPPGGAIGLGMNTKKAPFNDVEFRHAMAFAVNKDEIVQKAQFGYVTKASQTGLVLPGQKDWLPEGLEYPDGVYPYDQAKALEILDKAGYKKDGSGKIMGKDGKPIEFTFLVQNGWTDWIQAAQIIQSNLNALGLTVNVQTPEASQVEAQRAAANYDMVFVVHGGSCSMFDNYYAHLHSKAPPTTNYIFWADPKTDAAIEKLRSTIDPAQEKAAVQELATMSVQQYPTVPLWYGAHWFQFSTKHATNWPDASNPYAKPIDPLIIITNLKAVGNQ